MRGKATGFTLIEVLIAGSIMFIVLVMVTDSFLTARNSARHADNIITMLQPVPLVKADIQQQLQQNPGQEASGTLRYNGIQYHWRASLTNRGAPAPRYELDSGMTTQFAERFYLFQIELTCIFQTQQKTLSYTELVWQAAPVVPI